VCPRKVGSIAARAYETHPLAIIATSCIENGYTLLHNDRDFEAFERHLGLKVVARTR
jgi:predicted nucleic acid-binding protein